jgi:hypothetical protein
MVRRCSDGDSFLGGDLVSISGERQNLVDEIDDILQRLKETEDEQERMDYTDLLDEKRIELEDLDREIRQLVAYRR